jgi:hypothetical protein
VTDVNQEIRREADELLESGLRRLLEGYAEVHVAGSYALGLMAWRDLDIYLVRERIDHEAFFQLGGRIASLLRPPRIHYRDETITRTPGLPAGLYWGVYLGDERRSAWKIDIWTGDASALKPAFDFEAELRNQLTDVTRSAILNIKSLCWRHPEYRRRFSSADIYAAVLNGGVRDIDAFAKFLSLRSGVVL